MNYTNHFETPCCSTLLPKKHSLMICLGYHISRIRPKPILSPKTTNLYLLSHLGILNANTRRCIFETYPWPFTLACQPSIYRHQCSIKKTWSHLSRRVKKTIKRRLKIISHRLRIWKIAKNHSAITNWARTKSQRKKKELGCEGNPTKIQLI